MDIHNTDESLVALSFAQEQIDRLQRLRAAYNEKKQEERRRLEFVRWLVVTNRLTEGLPTTPPFKKMQKGNDLYVSSSSPSA